MLKHFGPNHGIPRSVLEVGDVDASEDGLVRLMVTRTEPAQAARAFFLLTEPKRDRGDAHASRTGEQLVARGRDASARAPHWARVRELERRPAPAGIAASVRLRLAMIRF